MTGISDRQFSVFPNEIFNNIIQLLPWGRATLLQCCHVNSTFYALSNPVLYSSLYLNEESRHNILFDTLSNRPIYGTYVDHLVLYITYPVNPRLATSLALMTNIKHLRIEGQMGEDRFLWEGITFPVAEALMSVVFPNISNLDLVLVLDVPFFSLLSMCHRLQGLYIVYCTSGTEHQATFPSVPQPRHQLRSLKMRSHRPEYPEESPHFRPLISFLHAFNVQWEQFKVDELIWEPGDDHVPTLSMMNALMLGSSAEALKKLELGRDPWRQLMDHDAEEDVQLGPMTSLRSLTLDITLSALDPNIRTAGKFMGWLARQLDRMESPSSLELITVAVFHNAIHPAGRSQYPISNSEGWSQLDSIVSDTGRYPSLRLCFEFPPLCHASEKLDEAGSSDYLESTSRYTTMIANHISVIQSHFPVAWGCTRLSHRTLQ